jgi:AICAR transformylase/IMP cyclohydrolase PurH
MKTATRSVNRIKNRLPEEKRIEFEISFWTMHDAIKNRDDFLSTIDGKTYDELIDMGKEVFQERKNAGFEKYTQYTSWDQMITQFTQERIDQNRRRKTDPRDENPSIMYKL